jgi:hypothetical protein
MDGADIAMMEIVYIPSAGGAGLKVTTAFEPILRLCGCAEKT